MASRGDCFCGLDDSGAKSALLAAIPFPDFRSFLAPLASRIELCDVLKGNDTFIHVKQFTSSAPLSHLFMQGVVSASSVLSDREFVTKANKKLDP